MVGTPIPLQSQDSHVLNVVSTERHGLRAYGGFVYDTDFFFSA